MPANPSTITRSLPMPVAPLPVAPLPVAQRPVGHGSSSADVAPDGSGRRPTRGDLLTVDPADRRRRAQTALLELVVTRSAGRRRG